MQMNSLYAEEKQQQDGKGKGDESNEAGDDEEGYTPPKLVFTKYLIIGAGTAAFHALEEIYKNDPDAEVRTYLLSHLTLNQPINPDGMMIYMMIYMFICIYTIGNRDRG